MSQTALARHKPPCNSWVANAAWYVHHDAAAAVHDARIEAGLTQKELARLCQVSQWTITRLENPEYRGHTLSMLTRVATALGLRLRLGLVHD